MVQRWLRRRAASGSRMSVRTPMSWPFKICLSVICVVVTFALLLAAYQLGRSSAGATQEPSGQVALYREKLQKVIAERDALATTVNAAESRLDIERSAEKQLVGQVKVLEEETAKLKEDLMFFESILPAGPKQAGVSIKRLRIDSPAPMQLRYALLLMRGGKGDREFVGNLQLSVAVVDHGRNAMIVFPDSGAQDSEKFKLTFKHYQRVEGILALPEGLIVKSVQARILQKGQLKAQQSANL
jgi:hypothetical protein